MDAATTGQNANLAGKVGRLRRPGIKLRLARVFTAVFMLLGFAEAVYAFCTLDNNPAPFISNDTSTSYCELCGYGYVTFEVANPFRTANLTNVQVVVNLGSSGLVYEPTAPNPITYSVNGGPAIPGAAPGGAGSVLTFSLPDVAPVNGNSAGTLTVTFAVRRDNNPEALVTANRAFSTTLTYDTNPTDASCAGYGGPYSDSDVLPLREPIPRIVKNGWNYDAGQNQGSRTDPVFGNNGDDIVWRIRIFNNGLADLQDLRFDDLMQTGSMDITYACPDVASANAVAANDGLLPGGSPCVAATNTINNFIVTDPFGQNGTLNYPWGDSVEVDVAAGTNTSVYLVGKTKAIVDGDAVDGSCVTRRTNTVNDVQWGCEVQTPAGGISSTSTGVTPGDTAKVMFRVSWVA